MGALAGFFDMGGYGAFIWPSYAIVAVLMLVLLFISLRNWRTSERTLAALQAERRGARQADEPGADPLDA